MILAKVFNTERIVLYERLTKVSPCDHNNGVPCCDTLVSILYLEQPGPAGCTVVYSGVLYTASSAGPGRSEESVNSRLSRSEEC